MKRKYKIDWWDKSISTNLKSVYYKAWWWPFWIRVGYGTNAMHWTIEEAEKAAKAHASSSYLPKYLGYL